MDERPLSPDSIRRLEDKVNVSKIVSGMMVRESGGGKTETDDAVRDTVVAGDQSLVVAGDPSSLRRSTQSKGDDCSTLTEDNASVVSSISNSFGNVLRQSMLILRGEAPIEEDNEDTDAALQLGPSSPMPTILSDRFNDETLRAVDGFSQRDGREQATDDPRAPLVSNGINFLQDDPSEMTYARRIALSLMTKNWYYPHPKEEKKDYGDADDEGSMEEEEEDRMIKGSHHDDSVVISGTRGKLCVATMTHKPNLPKAWAYFEHITLPRFLLEEKPPGWTKKRGVAGAVNKLSKKNKKLDRAEPGEDKVKTRLYSPIFTPLKQMGDFGLGVGLYFSTLRALTVMTFIAGLINIPNFIYFNSSEYSDGQPGVANMLLGSAVCTRENWVPCPNCTLDSALFERDKRRLASGTNAEGDSVTFALQNQCDRPGFTQGMINYGTLIFMIVAIFLLHAFQKRQEIAFDEDEQTTQDYSIVVQNPPGDARDPEEWKYFFEKNFDSVHVTCCTIGLDNDLLVKSLVERRQQLILLQVALPPGTDMDILNLAKIASTIERERNTMQRILANIFAGVPEHFGRLVVLNAKIQGLAQQSYPASNVFVTFETEAAQRHVLKALSVGSFDVIRNNKESVQRKHLFRKFKVLKVEEAGEPSTVRWEDLNETFKARMKQLAITTFVTFCAVALVAFIVRLCKDKSAVFGAYAIAGFNALFPMFAKFLTNLESHASEGDKQASLYFKIALFRWVNTAIVLTVIIPFTSTVSQESEDLLAGVAAVFFAEITTTNAIQLGDPVGHLQRHFLAPRAKTQEAMNLLMQGQVYELAERYTNMTKIFFLALWYCPIYPGALFFCAVALFINFFTDRFSLMRTWKPAPMLGTRISNMSRKYFLSMALCAMALVGSYSWSGFPYDMLCVNEERTDIFQGTWKVIPYDNNGNPVNGEAETVVVDDNTTVRQCNQDLLRPLDGEVTFPALSRWQQEGQEWMTEEQERVTNIYGWTSIAVLCGVFLIFLRGLVVSFKNLFRGTYKPSGEDQGINFSDVPSIASYIPEVSVPFLPFPLLAADVDGIDGELFEWEDPDKPYSYYDLTRDAELLLRGHDCTKDVDVFSKIRHWPPPRTKLSLSSSGHFNS